MGHTTTKNPLREAAAASVNAVVAEIRLSAHQELDALRAAIETRLDSLERTLSREDGALAACQALEDRLAASEAANAALADRVADAERAAATSAEEARATVERLEQEKGELLLSRDITKAHLDGEVHKRQAIAAELQAAREQVLEAKAAVDAGRLELQGALERVRALEQRNAAPKQPRPAAIRTPTDTAALDKVTGALDTLAAAKNGSAMLNTLVEMLREHFARVVLISSKPQGLVVWRSRGFDPPLPAKSVLRVAPGSPLARAVAEWQTSVLVAGNGNRPSGLAKTPIDYAIALPVVNPGRGSAIVYAENPPGFAGDSMVAGKIAEILAWHVRHRLQIKGSGAAADGQSASSTRRAARVRIKSGTTVVVNDAKSVLIDLSTLGAQVLSPHVIHPNASVRLVLPSETGGLSCSARVVWVVLERRPEDSQGFYRAGVQFTDVKTGELEGFFARHGLLNPAIRH